MNRRILFSGLLVLVLAVWAGVALGQEATTGAIEGTVTDPGGKALEGATVAVTSDQGTKTTTTDAGGHFRFQYLSAGAYGLTASLRGYTTAERTNIQVRITQRVRVEVVLTPGVSEKIEVVGAAPVVDLSTTTTGATITSALMSSIPLGRSFANTLALAPGVVSSGIDASNPSIAGASGLENTYVVDGMNIGNTGYGSAGSYSIVYGSLGTGVNFDYIEEIQVKTGGYEPEYGAALGGFINLVTKSGGNKFGGSVFSYQQFKGMEGKRTLSSRVNATYDPVGYSTHDYGIAVGGPVVKDKAFWFGAFDPTFSTRTRRTSQAVINSQGFMHQVNVDRTIYNYAANVKWLAGNNTFSVSAFGDPSRGSSGPQRVEAVSVVDPRMRFSKIAYGGNNVVGHWNTSILPNWFAEVSVAHHQDEFKEDPAFQLPSGTDRTSTVPVRHGGVGFFEHSTSKNTQYNLKLSNFLHGGGEHNVRYGAEYQDINYTERPNYSGPTGVTIRLPDGSERISTTGFTWDLTNQTHPDGTPYKRFRITRIRTGSLGASTTTKYTAFFLSDTWNPTRWLSIMAGIRQENEKLEGNVTSFTWKNNWSPRVHLTVDPTMDNRTKISAAYGRFFGKIPNDLAVRALSAEVSYRISYDAATINLTDPNNPTGMSPANQLSTVALGTETTEIAKDAKLSYEDEYVAGIEREVIPFLNLGVNFMYRTLGRTLEDTQDSSYVGIANGTNDFGPYIIRNPGPPFNPKPTRKYTAVTLKMEKRLNANWQMLGSYTYSKLRGNYEGYFRRDNGQSDPFVTSAFDFPYLLDPQVWRFASDKNGKLPNDRPHVVNAYGSYRFPFKLNTGLSVRVQSGVPLTKLGYNEVYGNGGEIVLEERGASGRGPTTTDIGLHVDYPIALGRAQGRDLEVSLDVFNILNQQKGVEFDYNYEQGGTVDPASEGLDPAQYSPCPSCISPDFAKPTLYQDPRQFLLALRVRF